MAEKSFWNNDADHDRWRKKTEIAAVGFADRANEKVIADKKKQYGEEIAQRPNSCYSCKKKNKCIEFMHKTTGGTAGAVSVDASVTYLCDKYIPMPIQNREKNMTKGAINSLLKRAKTGKL